jgi:hypothetical protein
LVLRLFSNSVAQISLNSVEAPIEAIIGDAEYITKYSKPWPVWIKWDIMAPKQTAGFITHPLIGPIPNPEATTVNPMANPKYELFAVDRTVATLRTTKHKAVVYKHSTHNTSAPVRPSFGANVNVSSVIHQLNIAARKPATHWIAIYLIVFFREKRSGYVKCIVRVTAGLKCAPDTLWDGGIAFEWMYVLSCGVN